MSLRNMEVQYVGDTLYLPPLERVVNHIIVRNEDVTDWEHFEPDWVCRIITDGSGWWECDACGCSFDWDSIDRNDPPNCNYCPNCGAMVMDE